MGLLYLYRVTILFGFVRPCLLGHSLVPFGIFFCIFRLVFPTFPYNASIGELLSAEVSLLNRLEFSASAPGGRGLWCAAPSVLQASNSGVTVS